jgi:transglutaminase-like putative cysteine protease
MNLKLKGRWKHGSRGPMLAFGAVFVAVLFLFPHLPLPWFHASEQVKYDTARPEPAMPGADTDGDGLFDNIEKRVGTSPYNPDTDRDGITDGDEYRYWTTRYDKESVKNESAKWLKDKYTREAKDQIDERYLPAGDLDGDKLTNIRDPDADGDTILDGDELAKGTDPANPDTDNDGITDDKDKYNTPSDPGSSTTNPNQTKPPPDYEPSASNMTSDTIDSGSFKNTSSGDTRILFWVEPSEKPRYWRTAAFENYADGGWTVLSPARYEYHSDFLPQEIEKPGAVTEDIYRMIFNNETTGYLPNALHSTRLYESDPPAGVMLDRLQNFYTSSSVHTYKFDTFAMPYTADDLIKGYFAADKVHSELTAVPSSVPLRVKALALTITTGMDTPMDKLKAILTYLKTNYAFTNEPQEVPEGVDMVDNFLFSARAGSSLEFASSFSLLCRYNSIPCRFVTGFALGDIVEGRRAVRAGHFHAWAEVLFANLGWVQFETSTADFIKSPSKVGADGSDPTVGDLNLQNGTIVIGGSGGGTTQNNTNETNMPVVNATFTIRYDVRPQLIMKGQLFEVKGTLVGPTEIGGGANIQVFLNETDNIVGSGRAAADGSFEILCSADRHPVGAKSVGIRASATSRNVVYTATTPALTMKKVYLCSNTTLSFESKDYVVRGEYFHYSVHMADVGKMFPPWVEHVDVLWDGMFLERVAVAEGNDTEEFMVSALPGRHNITAVFSGSLPYLYPSNVTKTVWVKTGGLTMQVGVNPESPELRVAGTQLFIDITFYDEFKKQMDIKDNVTVALDGRFAVMGPASSILKVDLNPSVVGKGTHKLTVKFAGNDFYPELAKDIEVFIKGTSNLVLQTKSFSVGTRQNLTGYVRDNLGNPVQSVNVNVSWLDTLGNENRIIAATIHDGSFVYSLTTYLNTPPGGMQVSGTFAGNSELVGSSNSTYLQLTSPSYLNATVPASLTRGEPFCVTGSLLDHLWHPIARARVVLSLGGFMSGVGWTDERGDYAIASEVPSAQNAGPATLELKYAGEGYRESAEKRYPVSVFARTSLNLSAPKNLEQGGDFEIVSFLTDDREAPVIRQNVTLTFAGVTYKRPTDTYGRAVFHLKFPMFSTKETVKLTYKGGDYRRPTSATVQLTASPVIVYRLAGALALFAIVAAIAYAVRRWSVSREPPPAVLEMLDRSWLRDRYRKTIFKVYTRLLSRMRESGTPKADAWTVREYELELQRKLRLDLYSLRLLTLTFEEARYSRHRLSSMDSRRAVASYRKLMESIDIEVRESKVERVPASVEGTAPETAAPAATFTQATAASAPPRIEARPPSAVPKGRQVVVRATPPQGRAAAGPGGRPAARQIAQTAPRSQAQGTRPRHRRVNR